MWKENKKYSSFDIALLLDKGKDWHIKKSFTLRFFFLSIYQFDFTLSHKLIKLRKVEWYEFLQYKFNFTKKKKIERWCFFFFTQNRKMILVTKTIHILFLSNSRWSYCWKDYIHKSMPKFQSKPFTNSLIPAKPCKNKNNRR